jgi:hypothetical protein
MNELNVNDIIVHLPMAPKEKFTEQLQFWKSRMLRRIYSFWIYEYIWSTDDSRFLTVICYEFPLELFAPHSFPAT